MREDEPIPPHPYLELEEPTVHEGHPPLQAWQVKFTRELAMRYQAIPLHFDGQMLTVAAVKHQDRQTAQQLRNEMGLEIVLVPLSPALHQIYFDSLYATNPLMQVTPTQRRMAPWLFWSLIAVLVAAAIAFTPLRILVARLSVFAIPAALLLGLVWFIYQRRRR